jgi:hypothetical protein
MRLDREWFVLAIANALLLGLVAMVNDGLASLSLSVMLSGLCVVLPAMKLGPFGLLACLVFSGLAGDAQLPTPAGFLTTLFVAGAGFVIIVRPWMGQSGRMQQLTLAWALNGAYFIAFTWWAEARGSAGLAFFERAAVDFCLSQILLLPVGLWFFDFQDCVLRLAGADSGAQPVARNH